VIGVPAPFGRQQTDVKWVDPDPNFDQSPQVAKVSQGPESLMAERLQLDLTGEVGDLEMIDSGFGPFNLTRPAGPTLPYTPTAVPIVACGGPRFPITRRFSDISLIPKR